MRNFVQFPGRYCVSRYPQKGTGVCHMLTHPPLQGLGGATAELMCDLLSFEADWRSVNITVNRWGRHTSKSNTITCCFESNFWWKTCCSVDWPSGAVVDLWTALELSWHVTIGVSFTPTSVSCKCYLVLQLEANFLLRHLFFWCWPS